MQTSPQVRTLGTNAGGTYWVNEDLVATNAIVSRKVVPESRLVLGYSLAHRVHRGLRCRYSGWGWGSHSVGVARCATRQCGCRCDLFGLGGRPWRFDVFLEIALLRDWRQRFRRSAKQKVDVILRGRLPPAVDIERISLHDYCEASLRFAVRVLSDLSHTVRLPGQSRKAHQKLPAALLHGH